MIRTRHTRAFSIGAATATALLVGSLSTAFAATAATDTARAKTTGLPAKAASQIAALQQIKRSLTPTEQKLDSGLAVTVLAQHDKSMLSATPHVQTDVKINKNGTTAVDIAVTKVTPELLGRLRKVGAQIAYASIGLRTVRAEVPESQLVTVASWKDVQRVSVASGMITDHETAPGAPADTETKAEHTSRIEAEVQQALASVPPGDQGSAVSEGDRAHGADTARANTHVQGVGVKVCALSDGVDSLAAAEASGDLPPDVDVLPGQAGSGDEGTAMLEIVHDLAPHASLGFATANTSDASFAHNIRALRAKAGCDIIVDDVLYFDEDPFQDGPIARAVKAVIADGALYFSSAGNEGNTIDGTSGNYEGNFVDSGQGVGKFAGTAEDFEPGSGVQTFEPISDAENAGIPVTLWWADPLGAANDDYDLYLFDSDNNLLAFSQNVQNGTQDPFELLFTPEFGGEGLRLAVVKYSGAARYFQLSALDSRFENSADGLTAYTTPGVIRGHTAVAGAFSVAAAPAAGPLPFDLEPGDPPNPTGPYPGEFTRHQQPERFTSDGPRRVFFTADGTPITPGNFTSTGGTVRQKPDITAADGVTTSLPGFTPFFGTSAAAPHAAAIAALVLSGNRGATTATVRQAFEATAIDLAPAGVDDRTGYGILRATRVLSYTGATPQPLVQARLQSVTPITGDGDPYLEPGESASLGVRADDIGDGDAAGTSVRLTTDDPQVTVTPRTHSYGTIAAGHGHSRSFTVALAADYPLGKPITLHAVASFAGALSPQSSTITVPTGEPASTPTTFAYTGPVVPIPDDDPTGASVPITVSGIGYAAKLTFSVDGTTCTTHKGATTVGIDHTFVADLTGTLTNPSGQSAQLFSAEGAGGNNMCQVVFDDSAAQPYSSVTEGDAPFTGTWAPDQPLAPLMATSVDGTWTFTVVDGAPVDTGSLRAVSLHVTGFVSG